MPDGQFPTTSEETFDLFGFMTGELKGWGVFEDRFGRIKERFEVSAVGRWEQDAFVLEEAFVYASGRSENRTWTLHRASSGSYVGSCADCKGEATGAFAVGFATLDYTFILKTDSRTIELKFADRFYPVGSEAVINRTKVTKWGVKVGEVSAVFYKDAARAA